MPLGEVEPVAMPPGLPSIRSRSYSNSDRTLQSYFSFTWQVSARLSFLSSRFGGHLPELQPLPLLWSWRSKSQAIALPRPRLVSNCVTATREGTLTGHLFFQVSRSLTSIMPRRPAPSPLRLSPPGPVTRGKPKFVMPTIPLPTFQPVSVLPSTSIWTSSRRGTDRVLSPLVIYQDPVYQGQHQVYGHMPSGSTSSISSISSISSWDSKCPSPVNPTMQAPWNHSGPMGNKLDLANVLAPLKPVAISP